MLSRRRFLAGVGVALLLPRRVGGDDLPKQADPGILGRWDLVVTGPDGTFPSWLEVRRSGYLTLVGSFVGQFGSARPVGKVEFAEGRLRFSVPPQWERRKDDLVFEGKLAGAELDGETTDEKG